MRVLHGVMVIYPLLSVPKFILSSVMLGLVLSKALFLLCHLSFWVLPVGGARGRRDLAAPGKLVVAVSSGLQRVWTLPEPSSSYLLGGMSTSQSGPSKRSKSKLPDPVEYFL